MGEPVLIFPTQKTRSANYVKAGRLKSFSNYLHASDEGCILATQARDSVTAF